MEIAIFSELQGVTPCNLACRLSAFLTIRSSQTERQSPLFNLKSLVACFGVLVRHNAMVRVLPGKSGQPFLQVGVVGVDSDPAFSFIKKDFRGFLPLG